MACACALAHCAPTPVGGWGGGLVGGVGDWGGVGGMGGRGGGNGELGRELWAADEGKD